MKRNLRVLIPVVLSLVMVFGFAMPVSAATTAAVTITNYPAFIGIANSASTYTLNSDGTGNSRVKTSTTYYSNPTSSVTTPTVGGATDAQCEWTLTNTSTVPLNITCTMADMSGGSDDSTNGNTGSAGATSYGGKTYFSGQASGAWVVAKSSGSAPALTNMLPATGTIKWGIIIAEQTTAWSGGTPATFITTLTATEYVP